MPDPRGRAVRRLRDPGVLPGRRVRRPGDRRRDARTGGADRPPRRRRRRRRPRDRHDRAAGAATATGRNPRTGCRRSSASTATRSSTRSRPIPGCSTSCARSSAPTTSPASCRSSSSRTRAPGASPGTRTRSTSRSSRPDRSSAIWLAVTEATLRNGCLHVLPGSNHEPIVDARARPATRREPRVLRDRRPRHVGVRARPDAGRATCSSSTATSCTGPPTTSRTGSGPRWCTTMRRRAQWITRRKRSDTASTTGYRCTAESTVGATGGTDGK